MYTRSGEEMPTVGEMSGATHDRKLSTAVTQGGTRAGAQKMLQYMKNLSQHFIAVSLSYHAHLAVDTGGFTLEAQRTAALPVALSLCQGAGVTLTRAEQSRGERAGRTAETGQGGGVHTRI